MSDTRAPAIDITLLGDAQPAMARPWVQLRRRPRLPRSPEVDTRTNIFDFDRASLERFFEEDPRREAATARTR